MTAAAGAVLGLEVHLVLSGERPARPTGNQLLAQLFGAQLHYVGCPPNHWGELEIAREQLTAELVAAGAAPHSIPIGGSTPTGALGYLVAYLELVEQCRGRRIMPAAVVHTSSSGGTHAGLVAGRALLRSIGDEDVPPVLAIGVAKGVVLGVPDVKALASETLALIGSSAVALDEDVEVDDRWLGEDYGVATSAGEEGIRWAAVHGGWVLDATYTGKGFAGLLGNAATGCGVPATRSCSSTPAACRPCSPEWTRRQSKAFGPPHAHPQILRRRSALAFEQRASPGRRGGGGRGRRAAEPRDRVRVHPARPVRGPPRHGVRDAPGVLRGAAR